MKRHETLFVVQWADRAKMLDALPRALEYEKSKHPSTTTTLEEATANLLDYCPPEAFERERRFPSLAMAQAWAAKNRDRDVSREPQVLVIEWTVGETPDDPDEFETVEEYRFDGGDKLERVKV